MSDLVTESDLRAIGVDPAEIARLQGVSAEVAATAQSPWEPRVVARAFARGGAARWRGQPLVFTMQGWIDLDHALSPLLHGGLPETLEDLEFAGEVFALQIGEVTPEEAIALGQQMLAVIAAGFAMLLRMKHPESPAGAGREDGFGGWLPLFAALVTQCGLSIADALTAEVGHAYALLAGKRRNDGWDPVGQPYAWREALAAPGQESAAL